MLENPEADDFCAFYADDSNCVYNCRQIGLRLEFGDVVGPISGPTMYDENVMIGAHSFVNKDIPDNSIAYGVPIKIKWNMML